MRRNDKGSLRKIPTDPRRGNFLPAIKKVTATGGVPVLILEIALGIVLGVILVRLLPVLMPLAFGLICLGIAGGGIVLCVLAFMWIINMH